jgi:hypothetical protein
MKRGADATILDEVHKSTPIGWAKHFGNAGIRDELLDLGSQRDIFVAVLGSRLDRIAALLDEQPERLNARNAEGVTPLAIAREAANEAVISFLQSRGALAE